MLCVYLIATFIWGRNFLSTEHTTILGEKAKVTLESQLFKQRTFSGCEIHRAESRHSATELPR